MKWQENESGLVVPENPKPKEPPPQEKIVSLVEKPLGWNEDGSLTLCPAVVAVLNELMLRRTPGGIRLPDMDGTAMRTLADAIYLHQRIEFAEYT